MRRFLRCRCFLRTCTAPMLNVSTERLIHKNSETLEYCAPTTADYGSTRNEASHARPYSPDLTCEEQDKYEQPSVSPRSLFLDKLAWLRRDSNKSLSELTSRFGTFLLGSVLWSIVLISTLVIPLLMLIVGSSFLNQCPREPRIPLFLIVGGSCSTLSNSLNIVDRFRRMGDATPPRGMTIIGMLTSISNCFSLVWFIAGCFWVYGTYKPSFSPESGSLYCHPLAYLFAFWILNTFFLFLLAILIIAAVTFGWSHIFTGHPTLPV